MERRSDLLIQELRDLLGTDEVYFQPSYDAGTDDGTGESYIFTGIQYPCFIMERTTAYQPRANNRNGHASFWPLSVSETFCTGQSSSRCFYDLLLGGKTYV